MYHLLKLELRRMMSIKLAELYAAVENPTAAEIKRVTELVKLKIADMSKYMNCNQYRPETDDSGKKVFIGKRVRELEVAHRRSQKRLLTIERKQALRELTSAAVQSHAATPMRAAGQLSINGFFAKGAQSAALRAE